MVLGSLFGGLIGGVSNAIGQSLNYKYQKKLMDKQYSLSQKSLKQSPTAQRIGLEEAGYNPMLAYQNQTYPTSFTGGNVNSTMGSDVASAMNSITQAKLADAQANKLIAETENIGNTPTDLILNGLKGLFGFGSGVSNNEMAQSLGGSLAKMSKPLRDKLMNFGGQFSNNINTNASGVLKGGVSYDHYHQGNATQFKTPSFTPLEEKELRKLYKSTSSYSFNSPRGLPSALPENY